MWLVLMLIQPQSDIAQVQEHLRQACEIIWTGAEPSKIDRCTKRAMAAMGDDDRLRDNELKRMLTDSERDLDLCRQELEKKDSEPTARRDP